MSLSFSPKRPPFGTPLACVFLKALKVMPSTYCRFPHCFCFASQACVCSSVGFLTAYGLSVAQWLGGSVAQWLSGALLGIISFRLPRPRLQFSCTCRKEMSKNDKVNGCAQNTTHSHSHPTLAHQ